MLLFYLTLLFLPTQLGRHFWPTFSSVAGIQLDYLSPTIYLTDIFIFLLFIQHLFSQDIQPRHRRGFSKGAGFITWLSPILKNPKKLLTIKYKILDIKTILLAIFILVGIIFSKNQLAGVYGFLKLLEFVFLGYYVAKKIRIKQIKTVALLFCFGVLFESFLAIAQYLNQGSLGGIFYFFGERSFDGQTPGIANASLDGQLILRPYGTLPHPNVLAGYLTIAMAIVISNFIHSTSSGQEFQISNFKKILFVFSLSVGTIALFLSMSRITIALWIFILCLSGALYMRKISKRNIFTIYYLLFTIVLLSIIVFSPLRFRFTSINLTDESIVEREELMEASFSMIKNNPILGVGLNNFLPNLPEATSVQRTRFYLQPAHNIYLLVASETGVIGLLIFLFLIVKTYKRIRGTEPLIHNSKFIILSLVLILGFFDHYFLTLQQGRLLFSSILGFCWALKNENDTIRTMQ